MVDRVAFSVSPSWMMCFGDGSPIIAAILLFSMDDTEVLCTSRETITSLSVLQILDIFKRSNYSSSPLPQFLC